MPAAARPVTENDEYAASARRILLACARRIATGEIEALTLITNLSDDIENAIRDATTERQLNATGFCQHPIRLRGRIDAIDLGIGELAPVYDSAAEPGGVLLTSCGNRRETVCPACSQVYKRDARQLVRAGLSGGKGIPDTVAAHPCVFATLTAPSFGPVQRRANLLSG